MPEHTGANMQHPLPPLAGNQYTTKTRAHLLTLIDHAWRAWEATEDPELLEVVLQLTGRAWRIRQREGSVSWN